MEIGVGGRGSLDRRTELEGVLPVGSRGGSGYRCTHEYLA